MEDVSIEVSNQESKLWNWLYFVCISLGVLKLFQSKLIDISWYVPILMFVSIFSVKKTFFKRQNMTLVFSNGDVIITKPAKETEVLHSEEDQNDDILFIEILNEKVVITNLYELISAMRSNKDSGSSILIIKGSKGVRKYIINENREGVVRKIKKFLALSNKMDKLRIS